MVPFHKLGRKSYLTLLLALPALLTSSLALAVDGMGFGTYSDGYRMGVIDAFEKETLRPWVHSGQMLMGNASSPYIREDVVGTKKDKDGREEKIIKKVTVNPWYFSADGDVAPRIMDLRGRPVWVHYKQARVRNALTQTTEYSVAEIAPITGPLARGFSCEDKHVSGWKKSKFFSGRIVKVADKGTLMKSHEVLVQIQGIGNQFKHMSIESDAMFNCAVAVLKSGQMVNVSVEEVIVNLSTETNLRVSRIEPMQGF